jgi:hypothetical protein
MVKSEEEDDIILVILSCGYSGVVPLGVSISIGTRVVNVDPMKNSTAKCVFSSMKM